MATIREKTFIRNEKGPLYNNGYFFTPFDFPLRKKDYQQEYLTLTENIKNARAIYLVLASPEALRVLATPLSEICHNVSIYAIFKSKDIYDLGAKYRILFRYCRIDKDLNAEYVGFDTDKKRYNFLFLDDIYETTDIFLWRYFGLKSAKKTDSEIFGDFSSLTVFDGGSKLEDFAIIRAQEGQRTNYVRPMTRLFLRKKAFDPALPLCLLFAKGAPSGVFGLDEKGDCYRILTPESNPIPIRIKPKELEELSATPLYRLAAPPLPTERETGLFLFYSNELIPFDSLETLELSKTLRCESFEEYESITEAPPIPDEAIGGLSKYRSVICRFTVHPPYLSDAFLPHPKNGGWHLAVKGWSKAYKPQRLSQMIESVAPLSSQGKSELETLFFELEYINGKILQSSNCSDEALIAWLMREKNTINYYLCNCRELFAEMFDQVADIQDSERLASIQKEIDDLKKKIKEKEKQLKTNPDDLGTEKRIERLKGEIASLTAIKKRAESEKPKRAVSSRRGYAEYLEELVSKKKQTRGDDGAFLRVRGDKESSKVELFYDFTDLYYLRYVDLLRQIIRALEGLVQAPAPEKFGLYIKDGKNYVAFSDSEDLESAKKYAATENAFLVVERR